MGVLKPCPFCGGEAEVTNEDSYGVSNGDWMVCCNECHTYLGFDSQYETPEQAIVAWNRRMSDMDIERELKEKLLKLFEETDRQEALNQVAISKTETTTCEWCEIARVCKYEVTFFEDDNRWATERSLLPKYCPNCGRRLEG